MAVRPHPTPGVVDTLRIAAAAETCCKCGLAPPLANGQVERPEDAPPGHPSCQASGFTACAGLPRSRPLSPRPVNRSRRNAGRPKQSVFRPASHVAECLSLGATSDRTIPGAAELRVRDHRATGHGRRPQSDCPRENVTTGAVMRRLGAAVRSLPNRSRWSCQFFPTGDRPRGVEF